MGRLGAELQSREDDAEELIRKTDEAIAAFRAAIKADPSHAHAHIELGMLLSQGVDWSFYGVWRVAVGILCWALVIGGVACYLMYDFSDDDTAPHSE